MAPPFNSFYFDCDSTLSAIEGVDELAGSIPEDLRLEILELTERAMDGTLPLSEVYEGRLHRLAPTRELCEALGQRYIDNLLPGTADVLAALQSLGKQIGVISGGFEIPVRILAAHLQIPAANVHAVPLLFDAEGNYRDFDRQCPLWRNGGKIDVFTELPASQRPVLYVGDGITDLETQGNVDLFVGFGGVATRERVKRDAEAWIDGPGLAPVLGIGLTDTEKRQLGRIPRFAALLEETP